MDSSKSSVKSKPPLQSPAWGPNESSHTDEAMADAAGVRNFLMPAYPESWKHRAQLKVEGGRQVNSRPSAARQGGNNKESKESEK